MPGAMAVSPSSSPSQSWRRSKTSSTGPEVLQKLHLSPIEAHALVVLLRRRASLVTPTTTVRRSRDPADDKFLECAITCRANYIVSADTDLLSLSEVQGIPILDVPAFWKKLAAQGG